MNAENGLRNKGYLLARLLIIGWAGALAVCLSLLLGLHFMPHAVEPIRGLASSSSPAEFSVHHFLSVKCSCSNRLIDHLKNRKALPGVPEIVHLVHATVQVSTALSDAGFIVLPVDEEEAVQNFNLGALPQLVVSRRSEVVYQGGYGPDQQHRAVYDDIAIIEKAKQGQGSNQNPVYGCANGHLQKSAWDILGVKYGRE